jgi:glutathione S-transferase
MTLTIHHLHRSQSERLLWLCEELSIPYHLLSYPRSPVLAPPEYKSLHPAGTSPVIHDSATNTTLAESSACVEYICRVHGSDRLFLSPGHRDYADFLYWFHWVNGSFQPALGRVLFMQSVGEGEGGLLRKMTEERFKRGLKMLDERLGENEWLAGGEFTAADVMVVFPLTTMRYWLGYSLEGYEGILGYLKRVGEREAYRRAMERGDPGMELLLGAEAPRGGGM